MFDALADAGINMEIIDVADPDLRKSSGQATRSVPWIGCCTTSSGSTRKRPRVAAQRRHEDEPRQHLGWR